MKIKNNPLIFGKLPTKFKKQRCKGLRQNKNIKLVPL